MVAVDPHRIGCGPRELQVVEFLGQVVDFEGFVDSLCAALFAGRHSHAPLKPQPSLIRFAVYASVAGVGSA